MAQSSRTDHDLAALSSVLRIKASGPDGTLYARNQREQPRRRARLLGNGDPPT